MRVEFQDPSHDERVVAEFVGLLERSSSSDRERILASVQWAAAKLGECGVELASVRPTGSVITYFIVRSLTGAYQLDTFYQSAELKTVLEEIFTRLLKSSRTVRIRTLTWTVRNFNKCVQYFLRKLSK